MKYLSLTSDQWTELEAALQGLANRGRYFKRLQSIKLNAQGYSLPTIRPLLDVHYNSVYQWIGRYEAEGLAGRRC